MKMDRIYGHVYLTLCEKYIKIFFKVSKIHIFLSMPCFPFNINVAAHFYARHLYDLIH